ncbi:hypothetical protein DY000_02024783 [Brassica cretica]|uniref:Uncharacterized protein n=1 Tax=Brassica cretica TaxID=69181 RepID=A0ABQ7E731_BRACR|nr:hypothetical protein DY000_02024783 [Brassica cretica]
MEMTTDLDGERRKISAERARRWIRRRETVDLTERETMDLGERDDGFDGEGDYGSRRRGRLWISTEREEGSRR